MRRDDEVPIISGLQWADSSSLARQALRLKDRGFSDQQIAQAMQITVTAVSKLTTANHWSTENMPGWRY